MKLTIAGATLIAATLLVPASAYAFDQPFVPYAPGDPATNGCPAGWEALQVSDLTPLGYRLPARIDSLANGGNGDGTVCGKPFSTGEEVARTSGETVPVVFDFRDNSLNSYTIQEPS